MSGPGPVTTLLTGEEGPGPTTLLTGEESIEYQYCIAAESDGQVPASTAATGEEEPPPTTLATGEEHSAFSVLMTDNPFGAF